MEPLGSFRIPDNDLGFWVSVQGSYGTVKFPNSGLVSRVLGMSSGRFFHFFRCVGPWERAMCASTRIIFY